MYFIFFSSWFEKRRNGGKGKRLYSTCGKNDDKDENFATVPLLDAEVSNKTAFLTFAIVASVLTVRIYYQCPSVFY